MSGLLEGKVAVVYGGGGGLGGGVCRVFAREGSRVFVAGRTPARLEVVANAITAAGGSAEPLVVDALDEAAVNAAVDDILSRAGRLDISFNLITRGDVQGMPIIDIETDAYLAAVDAGLRSSHITARVAAKRMTAQGSGVILHLNSASAHGWQPGMGSTGPADAATEVYMRYLAAELGPQGVRVCGIWTAGVAETFTAEKFAAVAGDAAPAIEAAANAIAQMSALKHPPRIAEVAETAAFLASDRASGITGTMVNVTAGLVLR